MAQQWFLPDAKITVDQDEIQGDVLIGMQKRIELFVFFEIVDVAKFKAGLKRVTGEIAYLRAVREYEEGDHAKVVKSSISFTVQGLSKLRQPHALPEMDGPFVTGAEVSAKDLHDDLDEWLPEYRGERIDGLLLVAGWNADSARAQRRAAGEARRLERMFGGGCNVVRTEVGKVRRTGQGDTKQEGHEHFGFADGVSQPGIEGLTLPVAIGDDGKAQRPPEADQGFPGQDLVKPGDFVLGYDREDGKDHKPAEDWMINGSYLVFRRLRQDVDAFRAYTAKHFAPVAQDPEQFGAKIVGRWKNGSPVMRNPAIDEPTEDEHHPEKNNEFEFGGDDPKGEACPFAAHIRKVYPRGDEPGPKKGGEAESSEEHRILRAGIAFGDDDDADKGLLFLCYQSSIAEKFEFIQKNWANNPNFRPTAADLTVPATPGPDLIIGQGPAPRTQEWATGKLDEAPRFVTATGGAYLFTPSRSGLTELAAPSATI